MKYRPHTMFSVQTTLPLRVKLGAAVVPLSFLLILITCLAALGQDCFDYESSGMPVVANIPTDDLVQDVVLHDDTLVLIERGFGIHLFDISQPEDFTPVGQVRFGTDPGDGAMAGDILLVADRGYGIYAVDISLPGNPALTDSLTFGQDIIWIETNGTLGACSDRDRNLILLDLSDASHPSETSRLFLPAPATGIAFVSHYIYVTCGYFGLQIIDVSNPTNPEFVHSVTISGFCIDLAINGNTAFILADGYGVFSLNISDPNLPEILSLAPVFGVPWGLAYAENRVFVAAGLDGLALIDASDPEKLRYLGTAPLESNCFEVVANKTHTFTACSYAGVFISDFIGASFPGLVDVDIPYIPDALATFDDRYICLASEENSFLIVDANDPQGPKVVATVATAGHPTLASVDGTTLVAHSDIVDIMVIDLSDPLAPGLIGIGVGASGSKGVAVGADVALSLHEEEGIYCYDISEPGNAPLASVSYVPETPVSIMMVDHYCVVTLRGSFSGLQVIDFSDPYAPVTIDWVHIPGDLMETCATEGYLFTLGEDSSFHVVDFTNPGNLLLIHSMIMENEPVSLAIHLETAYLQNNATGLDIVDIADPWHPVMIGSAYMPMLSISLHSGGGTMVSSSAQRGLTLLPVHCQEPGITFVPDARVISGSISAFPNPFNPRTTIALSLAKAGSITVEILDIRGQRVQILLVDTWLAAGDYHFQWDGTNKNGKAVSSGIYFARMENGDGISSTKLTLIR